MSATKKNGGKRAAGTQAALSFSGAVQIKEGLLNLQGDKRCVVRLLKDVPPLKKGQSSQHLAKIENYTSLPVRMPPTQEGLVGEQTTYEVMVENGLKRRAAVFCYFRPVHVHRPGSEKSDQHYVCLLCNDGVLVNGSSSQGLLSHLLGVASAAPLLPRKLIDELNKASKKMRVEQESSCSAAATPAEPLPADRFTETPDAGELLQISHALAYAQARQITDVVDNPQQLNCVVDKTVACFQLDLRNAIWIAVDKRAMQTLFTESYVSKEKKSLPGYITPTTKARFERAVVGLYVHMKKKAFALMALVTKRFTLDGIVVPFGHFSGDGWADRRKRERLVSRIDLVVPPAHMVALDKENESHGSAGFSFGTRLVTTGHDGVIRKQTIAKLVVALMEEYGCIAPMQPTTGPEDNGKKNAGLGWTDSALFSSTVDNGSNMRGAMTDFVHQCQSLCCFCHTLDNAMQWALGTKEKVAQSKNREFRELAELMRAAIKLLRTRKMWGIVANRCVELGLVVAVVTSYSETRWNGLLLTCLQLLKISPAMEECFFRAARRDKLTGTAEENKKRFECATSWANADMWGVIKALVPMLARVYITTQTLQGEESNLTDAFHALLALRLQLRIWLRGINLDKKVNDALMEGFELDSMSRTLVMLGMKLDSKPSVVDDVATAKEVQEREKLQGSIASLREDARGRDRDGDEYKEIVKNVQASQAEFKERGFNKFLRVGTTWLKVSFLFRLLLEPVSLR
jgi:hypothetical protein